MIGYINLIANCDSEVIAAAPQLKGFTFKTFTSVHQIPKNDWSSLIADDNQLFFQFPFLTALEDTHQKEGVEFRYNIVYQKQEAVAIALFQILDISGSDFAPMPEDTTQKTPKKQVENKENDCICPSTFISQQFNYVLQKTIQSINVRLLICGNMFITGEYGFLYNKEKISSEVAFQALNNIVENIQRSEKNKNKPVSLVLIKDFEPHHIENARNLTTHNFHEITAEPNMVLTLQPHWKTFQDYLASMTSKYRVRAKSVRKKGKNLIRKRLTTKDIEENIDRMYKLYRSVVDRADFKLAHATPEYFIALKAALGDRFQVIGYYVEGQLIGFISNFVMPDHQEAHFVGYDMSYNRSHKIYSNVLYDILEIGIEHQVKSISYGRTALEIKSTIGATGVQMNSFLKHRNFISNHILPPIVNRLRNDDFVLRKPFKEQAPAAPTKSKKAKILKSK